MLKKIILLFPILLFTVMLISSCKKTEEQNSSGQVIVKGKNKLIVSVYHHTWALSGINVYLKYNTTVYPGSDTSLYDWHTVSDPSGIAVFENLFEGNYFLYAKGLDAGIGAEVIGAAPAHLDSSTITNNEVYVTLYVTE